MAAQFAYAIASSQATGGPLVYDLHGDLCCLTDSLHAWDQDVLSYALIAPPLCPRKIPDCLGFALPVHTYVRHVQGRCFPFLAEKIQGLVCHADEFIVQPPFDPSFTMKSGKTAYIIHYTYGNDYDPQGNMVYGKGVSKFFHWDKRDYTYVYPPQQFPLPPDEVRSPVLLLCLGRVPAYHAGNSTKCKADSSFLNLKTGEGRDGARFGSIHK